MKFSNEEIQIIRPIYTSSSKKCLILFSLLLTFTTLSIHLILSIKGLSNTWDCKVNSPHSKDDLICYKLIQATTCRHISGPFSLDVMLDIQTEYKGHLSIRCPWSIAASEFHITFNLLSFAFLLNHLYINYLNAPKNFLSSKSLSIILGTLFFAVSTFDIISIEKSIRTNSDLRSWKKIPHLGSGVTHYNLQIQYFYFILTPISSFISSILMQIYLYLLTPTQKIELD